MKAKKPKRALKALEFPYIQSAVRKKRTGSEFPGAKHSRTPRTEREKVGPFEGNERGEAEEADEEDEDDDVDGNEDDVAGADY